MKKYKWGCIGIMLIAIGYLFNRIFVQQELVSLVEWIVAVAGVVVGIGGYIYLIMYYHDGD